MMAWGTPLTAVANAALTAAQWNASVRDNLLETAVAKATTSSGYYVGTGPNSLAERTVGQAYEGATETTTSTSATDLTTLGPTMTRTSGTLAIVAFSATISNNTVNAAGLMGLDVSGATTASPSTAAALRVTSSTANASVEATYVVGQSLAAGSNTFTAKYWVTSGTGTFAQRRLIVMPF